MKQCVIQYSVLFNLTDVKADYELLHLNILREGSEMYFNSATKSSCVCENIASLSKTFFNVGSWNNMVSAEFILIIYYVFYTH